MKKTMRKRTKMRMSQSTMKRRSRMTTSQVCSHFVKAEVAGGDCDECTKDFDGVGHLA